MRLPLLGLADLADLCIFTSLPYLAPFTTLCVDLQVVGPVVIPCEFSSPQLSFNTYQCTFKDADAWHKYAQSYVMVRRS